MKIFIVLISILLSISSKAWTQDCPGSPKVGGTTTNWNNCWGEYTHNVQRYKNDKLIGLFVSNNLMKGTYKFNARAHGINTGDIYIGEFNDKTQRHGQGIFYYADGGVFDGEWSNDKQSGFGTNFIFHPEYRGDVYIGEFKNGVYHGNGTYYWNDGRIYMGEFKNNASNGFGTWFATNGEIWSGQWKNWEWVSGNEVTNNYRGKMPDLKPYFDTYKYDKKDHQKYNLAKQNNNNSNSSVTKSNKTNFDTAKKQCEEIGFKKGTEKFGECVLDLTE
jgi:hypothetical protein